MGAITDPPGHPGYGPDVLRVTNPSYAEYLQTTAGKIIAEQAATMVERYRAVADVVVATVTAYNAAHPDGEFVKWAEYAKADDERSAFRSCLADLHAVQNGPPLPSYESAWRRAMDEAERLLGYAATPTEKP